MSAMEQIGVWCLAALIIVQPFLFLAMGKVAEQALVGFERRVIGAEQSRVSSWSLGHSLLIGLLLYLALAFVLRCCAVPWWLAALLPYLLAMTGATDAWGAIRQLRSARDANFVLWILVVLVLGVNLFQATDSTVSTRWVNNYGDLTFHLGMITSFVFGDNSAPEYHLYPGLRLSYPFFINLWSSALWWVAPQLDLLSLIFTYQWTLMWVLLYFFVKGGKWPLLPWAVLFGGGSYFALGQNSGPLIDRGVPWSSFLTTIWVTQRSALFGIVVLTAVCAIVLDCRRDGRSIVRAAVLLALAPLAHVHAVLCGVLFVSLLLLFTVIADYCRARPWEESARHLALFCFCLVPSLLFLPWILGKSGMTSAIIGWIPGNSATGFERLADAARVWLVGAWPMWALLLMLWTLTRKHAVFFVWVVLFVLFNFVKLAVWEWDQLKIFIALYVILLSIWAAQEKKFPIYLQLFALSLLFPSLYELWGVAQRTKGYEVYSQEAVSRAAEIRRVTEPSAIIAAKPDHNSLITLTGRRLYLGYLGTLSSHDIRYQAREALHNDYSQLIRCQAQEAVRPCPDYLLWTEGERQLWRGAVPEQDLNATELPYLFRLLPEN